MIKIFLDSGAFSLWQKLSKAGTKGKVGSALRSRRGDSFAYTESPDFRAYRRAYADFVREHEQYLECYPNLDVIGSPELTWANQVWLEDRGLEPLPVWHLGSDEGWLRHYLDLGYPYLCLGGMVGNSPENLRVALDRLWARVLTDDRGMPRVKVHGFGMTSFPLMLRYPWYSVDSMSWISTARYGGFLYAPRVPGGEGRQWLNPVVVGASRQSAGSGKPHLSTMPRGAAREVEAYLAELGLKVGRSELKRVPPGYKPREGEAWVRKPREVEVVLEPGVTTTNLLRVDCNLQFLRRAEAAMPTWPWALARGVKQGGGLLR